MFEAFRGEFGQKIDGKARVSIPSAFRRVLEAGDPAFGETKRPRLVMVFGGDRPFCECFSIRAMRRIEARILRMKTGDRRRIYLARNVITLSQELEIDADGRIVLPPRGRAKMGLAQGYDGAEAVFAGMLDSFQLWSRAAYDADLARQEALAGDVLPPGEDMFSLLPDEDEAEED